jgi:hypothetical protein
MRIATLVCALLIVTAVAVSAQTPYIAVYFNSGYSQEAKDCPGVGVLDTWYVAAVNFNVVLWNCAECADPWNNNQIKVVANPSTGDLAGVDYPGFNLVPGAGLTALICPLPIATEQTTWGQVKAVYGE